MQQYLQLYGNTLILDNKHERNWKNILRICKYELLDIVFIYKEMSLPKRQVRVQGLLGTQQKPLVTFSGPNSHHPGNLALH